MSEFVVAAQPWWQWSGDFLFDGSLGIRALLALASAITLFCGFVSLSSAAFMGMGACSASLLALEPDLPFALVLLVSVLVPAGVAVLIGWPACRLGALQLTMVTLGLAAAFEIALRLLVMDRAPARLAGIPGATGLQIALALAMAIGVLHRLRRSRFGLAWQAVRQDEIAAMSAGIDVPMARLTALVSSAAVAGLAGALDALRMHGLTAADYGVAAAVDTLAMATLGGPIGAAGPLLGALALGWLPLAVALPQELRPLLSGVVLVLAARFLPWGLQDLPPLRRTLRRP